MSRPKQTREEALVFHMEPRPGKFDVTPSVPMSTQRDLSLAYSPGVAVPCEAIAQSPETAYDYTNKGNLVAVISNGTAVLGLGNLGALASKPVMEGKAVLFKRFADVNSIDIELDTEDPEEIIQAVRLMGPTFGGINLEDIKAPECFIIEQRLKEEMDIPVFHDDQHGTAVICAAGLINALYLSGKKIEDCKIVLNGAGAAGIACLELIKAMGAKHDNCIMCDTKGVQWLAQFIRDVREDLNTPNMPFIIGELSTGGIPSRGDFQTAQADTAKLPEFKGRVVFVPTAEYYDTKAHELYLKGYWKGTDEQKAQWKAVGNDRPYHYLGSGKTYYLKGRAFGDAVLNVMKTHR